MSYTDTQTAAAISASNTATMAINMCLCTIHQALCSLVPLAASVMLPTFSLDSIHTYTHTHT